MLFSFFRCILDRAVINQELLSHGIINCIYWFIGIAHVFPVNAGLMVAENTFWDKLKPINPELFPLVIFCFVSQSLRQICFICYKKTIQFIQKSIILTKAMFLNWKYLLLKTIIVYPIASEQTIIFFIILKILLGSFKIYFLYLSPCFDSYQLRLLLRCKIIILHW